jgi:hypothetical protein
MKKLSALVCILLCLVSPAAGIGVEEIMSNFERAIRLPNLTGTFTVQMISKKGDVREIEATAFQKVAGESQMNRLFIFEFPPTVRDTGLLIHSYFDGTQDTMWIYLPAVRRIKRIALEQSGGGYFMGSDFTFADFIMKSRDDYERELQGEEVIDGRRCYKIKDWAVTLEQRQNMGYSYTVNYYGKEDFFLYARDYYDLSENLLKTYRVKEVFKASDWLYPTLVEMHNVQTDHRSIIEVSEYSTDEIPDRIFSTRYLQNR